MKIILAILLLPIFLLSPSKNWGGGEMDFDMMAIRECTMLLDELAADEPISINGTGGSFFDNQIHYVTLMLHYKKEVELPAARKILLRIAQQLMERLNKREDLQKYAEGEVFKPLHINVSLNFFGDKRCDPKHIVTVGLTNNGLTYRQQFESSPGERTVVLRETWEEALAAIDEQESR